MGFEVLRKIEKGGHTFKFSERDKSSDAMPLIGALLVIYMYHNVYISLYHS